MPILDIVAVLEQVTNTEGVSYQVFNSIIVTLESSNRSTLVAMFGFFVGIIGTFMIIANARSIANDAKQDKLNADISDIKTSLFLIKNDLGIVTVAEKPLTQDDINNLMKKNKSE
jgi:hypothetical protein